MMLALFVFVFNLKRKIGSGQNQAVSVKLTSASLCVTECPQMINIPAVFVAQHGNFSNKLTGVKTQKQQ